ncbi:MAG: OmpH family outer membrane protein [Calditrichaeota bacterium]|nr:OmpH family outer membrane protein [Calditrichota bacterium]
MGLKKLFKTSLIVLMLVALAAPGFAQKLKIGYVHSNKILATYKDALDVQKKIDELDRQYQQEGRQMQETLRQLQDQYDSQSLLLSDTKKKEKEAEIQNLIAKIQQFQQEKYNPQTGEIYKKQAELMQPVLDKINAIIKKISEAEGFDLVLDTASGNILYVSKQVTDLTGKILEELNKTSTVGKK